MNKKAIVLLSGGLDSILAVRIMQEQGIEVEAINFLTVFCTCTHKGCQHAATKAAQDLKIPLKVFNITEEYLEIIKNPKHGYGSNMNPCIDCRIFFFKKAGEYLKERGASFIVTGEVLGERPMSQRRDAILLIEKEAGLKGLIVRPLSAKLFNPTIPEQEGILDRDKMLDISGRSRKPQIALARQFGLSDYPCPAGGCLLTDPGFARRIKDLLDHNCLALDEVKLLKFGRHFRLSETAKLVIGRSEEENDLLCSLARPEDIVFKLKSHQGPFSILRGRFDPSTAFRVDGEQGRTIVAGMIERAASIVAHHTKFRSENLLDVCYWKSGDDTDRITVSVKPASAEEIERVRI
ncbi:MAG: 7-cyano-7-deazaguanine synthase [Candidatus Omnitrophota bacterium]|nr:7-cyano-7-deazaguanine synthase [Candidatus Omnitrophota bacterium]